LVVVALVASVLAVGGAASADGGCAASGAGGDWPVFGHEVTTTRFQDQEHTIGPDNVGNLQPAWVFPAAGAIESSPVEAGGCVYIGTQAGDVYALNTDSGQLVWHNKLISATTLSIAQGRVFVQSSTILTALDAATGSVLWQKDFSPGTGYTSIGSPLAFENWVVAGLTGCFDLGARPVPCRGYYAIMDQATGDLVIDGYDVSEEDLARGMEGPGFWSQPTYDPEDRYIYFGTANTRSIAPENPYSNALLKIDADPNRATFGEIVGYFRNTPLNPLANLPGFTQLCGQGSPLPTTATGAACIDDDDWPSSAVIYRNSQGRKLIGSTHSSSVLPVRTFASFLVPTGNYFAIDPVTMQEVWRAPTSGARAAVAAYDGSKIYYSGGEGGEIYAVDKDTGTVRWQASAIGGNQWQHVSAANGVVYTPSGNLGINAGSLGLLMAYDARDGTPLLQRPMALDIGTIALGTVAGGITIARNTVFAPVNALGQAGSTGFVVAYRLP
jgi:outer membrane protein assembly factor BamB